MNPDTKKDKESSEQSMIEEKHQDVLRATAEAEKPTVRQRNLAKIERIKMERRAFQNTLEELHQKLLTEVKARVKAEEALARAQTTLRAHDAAKLKAERAASLATANVVYFSRARQELEDGLTSHLRAWEKERQDLTSQRNQAVESLKWSARALTLATAKLLESGHTAPKPAQLGGEFQTKTVGLRAEICAAQTAGKTGEVEWNMFRTNFNTLERYLRAEIAEKNGKIIRLSSEKKEALQLTQKAEQDLKAFKAKLRKTGEVKWSMFRTNFNTLERYLRSEIAEKNGKIVVLSSEKKEAFQVTQKAEQDLEAFKAKLVEMEGVMTSLQIDAKEKDMRCHVLEKALDKAAEQSAADLQALQKTADKSAADLKALQKQAEQSAADLQALQKTADKSAADLKALQKTADKSAADLKALQKQAEQSAADLQALQKTADKSAADLKALQKQAEQSAADLQALQKTADKSAADLKALQKQAEQSAADLKALQQQAEQSAADLKALQKQAEQSAADLESQQKAKTEELKECQEQVELLQQQLKRQAEKKCQSQETQTEKSIGKKKKKGGCFGRLMFWRKSQHERC